MGIRRFASILTTALLATWPIGRPSLADDPASTRDRSASDPFAPIESFTPEQREHWAFRPLKRVPLPRVKNEAWVKNSIDRFILASLEEVGYRPAAEIDRVGLIRRATYDLTGLPPTWDEVVAFVKDDRADAYERLVDRLLASPRYGERWAQHWLDLAHYADSNGFELDAERPDAWRYRDWVIRAFNSDMPYDEFASLQLAGDELRPGDADALIATGFARSGPREVVAGNFDPKARRQSELTEIVGTVGSVFLGLTLACARCHDHKFDPLPTTDYYRLQAIFAGVEYQEIPIASEEEKKNQAALEKEIEAKLKPWKDRLRELESPYRSKLREAKRAKLSASEREALETPESKRSPIQKKLAGGANTLLNVAWEEVAAAVRENPKDDAERERLKRTIFEIERTRPRPPARASALIDKSADAPETRVLRRGDVRLEGPRVSPRPPGILLAAQPADAFPAEIPKKERSTGRRSAFARWLTRPDNPLTARVIVNRLWQHHFGRGIVSTPGDFGARGEPPTHPELLDRLARDLIDNGGHLKPIHKMIMMSAAYRQASDVQTHAKDDPENTLFWRMNRRRMDAEAIRDALLAVSGELNDKMGGPGVLPPIEKDVEALIFTEAEVVDLWPETPDPREHLRRSIYLFRKRNVRYPLFEAFDAPDMQNPCSARSSSTHALQPLMLLNADFAIDRAKSFVGRVFRESGSTSDSRLSRAWRLLFLREPSARETDLARAFLATQAELLRTRRPETLVRPSFVPDDLSEAEAAAWVDLAQALLNRSEFLYIP